MDGLPDAVCVKDRDLVYRYVNRAFLTKHGLDASAILGHRAGDFVAEDVAQTFEAADRLVFTTGGGTCTELTFVLNGRTYWTRDTSAPILDEQGKAVALFSIFSDITTEKQAVSQLAEREVRLLRINYARSALLAANNALVRSESESELIHSVCEAIAKDGTFLCFFAWRPDDPEADVPIAALSGSWGGFLDGVRFNWSEGPLGQGAAGLALRTGRIQVINDLYACPSYTPWIDRIHRAEARSMAALPVLCDEAIAGVLAVYSHAADAFGPEEVTLFEEFARDLGFGIRALRTDAAYRGALEREVAHSAQLSGLLTKTIEAIASVAEHRDPYTARHQNHVADLAEAIAREIGLDGTRIEGLRLAASVHDIGKVEVPSDILTMPRKLTPAEFEVIKIHPTAGYEILKGIEFPWPIADIVYQHHECIDGSGYPRGLKGDQILLEAQILSCADIVEAVAAHRPYRPALGMQAGQDVIRRLAGTKLDPRVAGACIAIIESGRFTFAT